MTQPITAAVLASRAAAAALASPEIMPGQWVYRRLGRRPPGGRPVGLAGRRPGGRRPGALIGQGSAATEEEIARRGELRASRQQILWRPVGGREVIREQLQHLMMVADHPAVTLQIMPFSAGAHSVLRRILSEM